MALNTGGFRLNVMPVAPTGTENLGKFDVGQVLAASRVAGENVEQAFNTPFRVQQEMAKTKTAQANQAITEATAAALPAKIEADLAGQRESTKSKILENKLSSNTLAAKTKLAVTKADLSEIELAFANETNPIKKQQLQATLDSLRMKADADKAEYDAALEADLFTTAAQQKAAMGKAGMKALAGFDESGTREIAPGVIQTLTPTADGAAVTTTTTPAARALASKPQTVPVFMGTSENGNAIIQNHTIDPITGEVRSAIGGKIEVKNPTANTVGIPADFKARPNVTPEQEVLDKHLVKNINTFPSDKANLKGTMEQLDTAINALKDSNIASGRFAGMLPESGPLSSSARRTAIDNVRGAIQYQLRAIYGAQFTEKEGERFFNTVFNKYSTEDENIQRINALKGRLQTALDAKQSMYDYYQKNNTFAGYNGPTLPQGDIKAESVETSLSGLAAPSNTSAPAAPAAGTTPTITSSPYVIQKGVTFVLQPDGVTYLPE